MISSLLSPAERAPAEPAQPGPRLGERDRGRGQCRPRAARLAHASKLRRVAPPADDAGDEVSSLAPHPLLNTPVVPYAAHPVIMQPPASTPVNQAAVADDDCRAASV